MPGFEGVFYFVALVCRLLCRSCSKTFIEKTENLQKEIKQDSTASPIIIKKLM